MFTVVTTILLIALAILQVGIMNRQLRAQMPETVNAPKRKLPFWLLRFWPICVMFVVLSLNWVPYYLNRTPFKFDSSIDKFETITDRSFQNETVELDGKQYTGCTFTNVTLKYNGTTPIRLDHDTFNGAPSISTDNPAVFGAIAMLKGAGYLSVNAPMVAGPERTLQPISAPSPKPQ